MRTQVTTWQSGRLSSLPNQLRGFDSRHPLHMAKARVRNMILTRAFSCPALRRAAPFTFRLYFARTPPSTASLRGWHARDRDCDREGGRRLRPGRRLEGLRVEALPEPTGPKRACGCRGASIAEAGSGRPGGWILDIIVVNACRTRRRSPARS